MYAKLAPVEQNDVVGHIWSTDLKLNIQYILHINHDAGQILALNADYRRKIFGFVLKLR